GAALDIARALAELTRVRGIEVIIVGRGGGSLEDLWAFNDERVARALAASPVPVVSAGGHEIDGTLPDRVAYQRAPPTTPAPALVVPDRRQLVARLQADTLALCTSMQRRLRRQRDLVAAHARHLRHPRQVLKGLQLRVDELSERMSRAVLGALRLSRQR